MMRALRFISTLLLLNYVSGSIIRLKEGNSFLHYIENSGVLQTCVLHISTEDISLFPNNIAKAKDPVKDKLFSTEKRACGFKLLRITARDPMQYNLSATFMKNNILLTKQNNVTIQIVVPQTLSNTTEIVDYGSTNTGVKCTIPSSTIGFCALFSPSGELAKQGQDCTYFVNYIQHQHIGKWRCDVSFNNNVEPETYYITWILKEKQRIETWYKEENGFAILGCKHVHKDAKTPLGSCSMKMPNSRVLNIQPNSATSRYDSLGTNFTNNFCQLQFKLPLQKHETGTWKCALDNKFGFINVKKASNYSRYSKIIAKVGTHPWIRCEVPYSATNCFIVSPEGKVFIKAAANYYENGLCEVQLSNISADQFGKWTCHFSRRDIIEDDVITFDIVRYDVIESRAALISVSETDDATILFQAAGPIFYCVLEDPHGNTYHIWPHTNTSLMEYYGAGFAKGDCGLRIKNVSSLHGGIWKAMTSTDLNANQLDKQIIAATKIQVLPRDQFATASSSGALIGLMVAVAIIIIIVISIRFVQSKKRKEHSSPANTVGDEDSGTTFALTHF